jgi:hypothetical protein
VPNVGRQRPRKSEVWHAINPSPNTGSAAASCPNWCQILLAIWPNDEAQRLRLKEVMGMIIVGDGQIGARTDTKTVLEKLRTISGVGPNGWIAQSMPLSARAQDSRVQLRYDGERGKSERVCERVRASRHSGEQHERFPGHSFSETTV